MLVVKIPVFLCWWISLVGVAPELICIAHCAVASVQNRRDYHSGMLEVVEGEVCSEDQITKYSRNELMSSELKIENKKWMMDCYRLAARRLRKPNETTCALYF